MTKDDSFFRETEILRSLRVLEEIENDPHLSQRDLAERLGVALGIANACIHSLVSKGLIKIRGSNNRSLTYHLTKRGVLHKTWLAMEWTKNTVQWYRRARDSVAKKLQAVARDGVKTVALYGHGDLTEIALLCAAEADLEIVGIIDGEGSALKHLLGHRVGSVTDILAAGADAIVLCTELTPDAARELSRAANGLTLYRLI